MAFTFNKSNQDGTIGAAISSGDVNALFDTLTNQERLNGVIDYSKLWITSDTDATLGIGFLSPGYYNSYLFGLLSDNESAPAINGDERKYGALEVVSATSTIIYYKNDDNYPTLFPNDLIVVGNVTYRADVVTDIGDGTSSVTCTAGNFSVVPSAGEYISSCIEISFTAGVAKPVWREEKILPSSAFVSSYSTADILIAG